MKNKKKKKKNKLLKFTILSLIISFLINGLIDLLHFNLNIIINLKGNFPFIYAISLDGNKNSNFEKNISDKNDNDEQLEVEEKRQSSEIPKETLIPGDLIADLLPPLPSNSPTIDYINEDLVPNYTKKDSINNTDELDAKETLQPTNSPFPLNSPTIDYINEDLVPNYTKKDSINNSDELSAKGTVQPTSTQLYSTPPPTIYIITEIEHQTVEMQVDFLEGLMNLFLNLFSPIDIAFEDKIIEEPEKEFGPFETFGNLGMPGLDENSLNLK